MMKNVALLIMILFVMGIVITVKSNNSTVVTPHNKKSPTSKPNKHPTSKPQKYPTKKPFYKYPTTKPAYKKPTSKPSKTPTTTPTFSPSYSKVPSLKPSIKPSVTPTYSHVPSVTPTFKPTSKPTVKPTFKPSVNPTFKPSLTPTTAAPTSPFKNNFITNQTLLNVTSSDLNTANGNLALILAIYKSLGGPSSGLTLEDIDIISVISAPARRRLIDAPSSEPTFEPTSEPTFEPTYEPTFEPTYEPTFEPTYEPTFEPTYVPTFEPTFEPSFSPTIAPNKVIVYYRVFFRSNTPLATFNQLAATLKDSIVSGDFTKALIVAAKLLIVSGVDYVETGKYGIGPPTLALDAPSFSPTSVPTVNPTFKPSVKPTIVPSVKPSTPSVKPTSVPSRLPSTLVPTCKEKPHHSPTHDHLIVGTAADSSSSVVAMNTNVIIGIVVVAIFGIFLLSGVYVAYRRYKKNNSAKSENQDFALESFYLNNETDNYLNPTHENRSQSADGSSVSTI